VDVGRSSERDEQGMRAQAGAGAVAGDGGRAFVGGGVRLPIPGLPGGLDAKRLLWFGGLGALATIGILEWPVALVVGAGSVVAERLARDGVRREEPHKAAGRSELVPE
jgi:hypothetical protein